MTDATQPPTYTAFHPSHPPRPTASTAQDRPSSPFFFFSFFVVGAPRETAPVTGFFFAAELGLEALKAPSFAVAAVFVLGEERAKGRGRGD
ncbi:hypothetical protein W97_07138 [Coniosporium apollinis CBS 100218]|uniref:Uncharacterized protein n=1 Tax=Coniosporium apollinis (strain CBS 100218) TaxID=1168221 RepID=R7Z1G3_CONA1|nr:uncharacterized protein W97_07138 [Coniosporium apollinis CBS 100218]EON67992.1 hypothetical protein W97_07138 [Coniosporium apollinis CBS 100218]